MRPAPSRLPAIACAAIATPYGIAFLGAESQLAVGALLALAAAAILLGARTGALDKVRDSIGANQKTFDGAAIAGVLAAATGVAGILLALGLGLAASGIAVAMTQPPS